eukprot:TRINITY_DN9934_c0_g2_i1.p1 TRINITY_DN9934_c0_g2~~TRINITY_DN9934_c0_g2_i1.p1  ORF type:complete len:1922 (+),score=375.34 TRINITY_DN9934_c0_g2_i1:48-5813(+)
MEVGVAALGFPMRHRSALWLTAAVLAVGAHAQKHFSCPTGPYPCICGLPEKLNHSTANDTLELLAEMNCRRVQQTVEDHRTLYESRGDKFQQMNSFYAADDQVAAWQLKARIAVGMCNTTKHMLEKPSGADYEQAAYLAINAWGSVIVGGSECCDDPKASFCSVGRSGIWSLSTWSILGLLVMLVIIVVSTLIDSMFLHRRDYTPPKLEKADENSAVRLLPGILPPGTSKGLAAELQEHFLQQSCLRVLPAAPEFARVSACLFGALAERFDFQVDNVRNQYEHLCSLWRSHVAMVADREIYKCVHVDETSLLYEAIEDLYKELMEGYVKWRELYEEDEETGIHSRDKVPTPGGTSWPLLPASVCFDDQNLANEASTQLCEIAMYLLVWGEGGNLRFMPELLYFITELGLAAQHPGDRGMYHGLPSSQGDAKRSTGFLSQIVRPIYDVVFHEVWQSAGTGAGGKPTKKIHDGFDAFLPRDCANYDDWDELFLDPKRLVECLELKGGKCLFELDHEDRFASLVDVDWITSLDTANTKTHREIHSLWGVFATTHRVLFVHVLLFMLAVFLVDEWYGGHSYNKCSVPGGPPVTRLITMGQVINIHGTLVAFAQWHVTGRAVRAGRCLTTVAGSRWLLGFVFLYGLRRSQCSGEPYMGVPENVWEAINIVWLVAGSAYLLWFPSLGQGIALFDLTKPRTHTKLSRYGFWMSVLAVKFIFGVLVVKEIAYTIRMLNLVTPSDTDLAQLGKDFWSPGDIAHILMYCLLWFSTFLLFVTDTQLWFVIGCSILGIAVALYQRRCRVLECSAEDAVAKIPERFTEKVLPYAAVEEQMGSRVDQEEDEALSSRFLPLWDRIMEYCRYEDKVSISTMGNMSFSGQTERPRYRRLLRRIVEEPLDDNFKPKVAVPELFREDPSCERFTKTYCFVPDPHFPTNDDMQWRLLALSRGLALPMPRPYRPPYIPGLTVLIPHYGEAILLTVKDLFPDPGDMHEVPLIDWLVTRYADEFLNFTNRQQSSCRDSKISDEEWPRVGTQWDQYTDKQWEKICGWSSMRMQTLWRTVAGMILYHPALQALYDVQADMDSVLADPAVWDPAEVFTCMISMQMYKFFNKTQLQQTNRMFKKFPKSLKVAYIDDEPKGPNHEVDNVNACQTQRYYSCLIDRSCQELPDGKRVPRLRLELPGFPILGDGKGDNQNHAIPFMRGAYSQCIDANQGAYFEQMLMLPNVLGEFRTKEPGDDGGKKIIGLPEHITSDIGSIGDFAASAEKAFGTLLQRTYASLGARMHYGHPDIMNKQYMMQQGGVSKATKTLNLSEDIFAGMDFTLRGDGRHIFHREYMHLAKGRDLGFNAVLGFFSKLSSGAGEQVITRQMYRLGNLLDLPEVLAWWYAHVGYYMTQFLISIGMPILIYIWLLVLCSECEDTLQSFGSCQTAHFPENDSPSKMGHAEVMARLLSTWFSGLLLFFLFATNLPLFVETWWEFSLKVALKRFFLQFFTMSPLLFIFQAKLIGFYVLNELRYGGAQYVATGRSLPTERRPFIGKTIPGTWKLDKAKIGGLYLDYCHLSMYHGAMLLLGSLLVLALGGVSQAGDWGGMKLFWMGFSVTLTTLSWLFAPFVFNPYNFDPPQFWGDVKAWFAFFWDDLGQNWVDWWEKVQLRKGQTNRRFVNFLMDVTVFAGFFFLLTWFALVNQRFYGIARVFDRSLLVVVLHGCTLMPPIIASIIFSICITAIEALIGRRRARKEERDVALLTTSDDGSATDGTTKTTVPTVPCLPPRLPLMVTATFTVLLQLLEATVELAVLLHMQWFRTFVAGIIMKWTLRTLFVTLAENVIRSHCFEGTSFAGQCVLQWVRANRMFRDVVVSAIILLCLSPIVFVTFLNDYCCPGCSWHQLLIYRDTGHRRRMEAAVLPSPAKRRQLTLAPEQLELDIDTV